MDHATKLAIRRLRAHPRVASVLALLSLPILAFVIACGVLWQTAGGLAEHRPRTASRLYARPVALEVGQSRSLEDLEVVLAALGYRPTDDSGDLARGSYFRDDDTLRLRIRDTESALDGIGLAVRVSGGELASLAVEGLELEPGDAVPLGRPLLHHFVDDTRQERRPVTLATLPNHVVHAVLAAEDHEFFQHPGLSLTGIARAAVVNLRAGEVRQGGSTITQQLVKNLYLRSDRKLARKTKEAVLALLTEARYSKERILEAYLNEIYWGSRDGTQLMGIGAAARAFFGKDARELSVEEAATLAGMIKAPGEYSPSTRPDAARSRRDLVLAKMVGHGWLEPDLAATLGKRPVTVVASTPAGQSKAPYFAAFARQEASDRFGVDDVEGAGCSLHSTLDLFDQLAARRSVREKLPALERASRSLEPEALQGALVSLDPRNGHVLAYVGGRDFDTSQFDRVSRARRQAGSAFKPVVYAAALRQGMGYPNELIRDTPIVVKYGRDSEWRPRNGDRAFRGPITVRRALEASRNVPAVRLALSTGLDEVRRLGQAMGIESPLGSIPSLALGAFEATPLELATVYATLAARGERPVVHGLTGIEGCSAPASPGEPASERVLDPDTAFLVTSMLQGSLDRGTAWKARRLGVTGPLAGKTGSSDDLRDAWFAGYSPDRVTVVWVGSDENTTAGLSGADGALPVWADFVRGVSPPGGPPRFESPAGYRSVTLDPDTGLLAAPSCPRRIVEHLPPSQVPWRTCVAHLPELDLVPFGVFDGTRGPSGVEAPAGGPIAVRRIPPGTPSPSRGVDPIELFRQRQKRSLGSVDGPPPTTGVDDG